MRRYSGGRALEGVSPEFKDLKAYCVTSQCKDYGKAKYGDSHAAGRAQRRVLEFCSFVTREFLAQSFWVPKTRKYYQHAPKS